MKKVRTVIWDLDETVWFYKEDEPKILCNKFNITKVDEFTQQYYGALGKLFSYFKGKIVTYPGVVKYIQEQMPILKEFDVSVEFFLKSLTTEKKNITTVNSEAVEMIKYCYQIGLRNISITDWFTKDQEVALSDFNVMDCMDKIYGCDDVYFKNSPEKIPQVIEKLKLEGRQEEFVMIGDSLTSDIFFAKMLGIKSVWYNPKGKKNNTEIIPDLEVQSLLELKSVF